MPADMRNYWRDPSFWRWWWGARVGDQAKSVLVLLVGIALGIAGYFGAHGRAANEEPATVAKRVVTVLGKTKATVPARVVTESRTVTHPSEPKVVTVRRDGRTVVVRPPAATVTEPVTVRRPAENPRPETVIRTETADRPTTVTEPGRTNTVTQEVTQPVRTVTETTKVTDQVTVTDNRTVTDQVTVTQQVTVTEEVTVTVTETEKKK